MSCSSNRYFNLHMTLLINKLVALQNESRLKALDPKSGVGESEAHDMFASHLSKAINDMEETVDALLAQG